MTIEEYSIIEKKLDNFHKSMIKVIMNETKYRTESVLRWKLNRILNKFEKMIILEDK